MAQMVKNPPVMWETWVRSLGGEDTLEKEMATHSSILAWRIPWTEEPGGLQSMGRKELDMTERLNSTARCGRTVVRHWSFYKNHLENSWRGGGSNNHVPPAPVNLGSLRVGASHPH